MHGGGRSYSNCGANYSQPNLSSWGTLLWFRSLRRDCVIFKELRRGQNLRLSLPALVEHVVEHVPGQLLDPVHDQPVRDHHVPDRVLVVVGNTEQVRVVALRNILWLHSQRVFFTLIVVGDVETSVQVETCHPALPPPTCGRRWRWKILLCGLLLLRVDGDGRSCAVSPAFYTELRRPVFSPVLFFAPLAAECTDRLLLSCEASSR